MPLHGNPLGPVTKILVDTNVFHATALMEQCIELTRVRLGDVENEIRLLVVRPKNFTRQETADAPALAAICDLARQGGIKLCISIELYHEISNGSLDLRTVGGDLLAGVELEWVDTPIERSRFFQMDATSYASKQVRIDYCKWLLRFNGRAQEFPRHGVSGKALPAYEQESAALLDRFAELCKNANGGDEDKLLDVFHLWTAERAGIPYLLTYDARFVNFMTKTSRATLRTEPILPAALANRLGIDFEGSG